MIKEIDRKSYLIIGSVESMKHQKKNYKNDALIKNPVYTRV